MKTFLTPETRLILLERHRSESDRKSADRIKAVLLSDDGYTNVEIGRILFINEETVSRHISDYTSEKKLQNGSGGSESKLTKVQSEKLMWHLEKNTYMDSREIIAYVKDTFGITYSRSGMTLWLHNHHFSYKYPSKSPANGDAVQQEAFIDKYKSLKKSLPDDEVILFGDGVHPSMQTKVACGWIKTGINKDISTTASRTRINIFGAINLDDMRLTHASYKTIDSEAMSHFLQELRNNYGNKKIHLILDQGPYNKSSATMAKAKALNIEIHHLPPYSPNLNPIERVWKVMNEKKRNNVYFKSSKDFKDAVLEFFQKTWPMIQNDIKSRINDNFQRRKIGISI